MEEVLKEGCWQRSEPLHQTGQSLAQPGGRSSVSLTKAGHNRVSLARPGVQEQGQNSPLQVHEGRQSQPGLVDLNRLSPGVWLYKLGVLRRCPSLASMRVGQLRTLVVEGHTPEMVGHSLVGVDHSLVGVGHNLVVVGHNPVEQVEDSKPEEQKVDLEAPPSPEASRRKIPSFLLMSQPAL